MKPAGSLLCSQKCTTGPCQETDEASTYPHTLLLNIHFNIIVLSTLRSPRSCLTFGFLTKILCTFLISYACYMTHPSHHP
jgi:hypothetical protein